MHGMDGKTKPERRSTSPRQLNAPNRGRARNGDLPDRAMSLDELIDREDEQHPGLRDAVELGVERRRVLSHLASLREAHGISQQEVAARMGTAQPAVARLESGVIDPKFSTLQKYAGAVGLRIEFMDGAAPSRGD